MMVRSALISVCLIFEACSHAQTNTENQFDFYNDGTGHISRLPKDDISFSKIQFAAFKPDPDFYLEPMSDSAFTVIEKMPSIVSLEIRCLTDPVSERTARLIAKCRNLKFLFIENAVVSHAAIPVLLEIPLEVLVLRCIPVSNNLQSLNTKNLRNLTLRHCGLQNNDARAIVDSPKLQYLDVHGNEYINTDFILRLDSLKKLKVLQITGAKLSIDNCHQVIKSFPELKCLNAETSTEGEALLKSNLFGFALLPPHDLGQSPMWGFEGNESLGTNLKDPMKETNEVTPKR